MLILRERHHSRSGSKLQHDKHAEDPSEMDTQCSYRLEYRSLEIANGLEVRQLTNLLPLGKIKDSNLVVSEVDHQITRISKAFLNLVHQLDQSGKKYETPKDLFQ